MQKIKVIFIGHASLSVFLRGQKKLKQMFMDDWFSLTAQQVKKYHPEIDIECWAPEKTYKHEKGFYYKGMRYRQFPTVFSPIYGLDLSIAMIKALKREAEKAKVEDTKLIIHLHEHHNLHGVTIATFLKDTKIISQHHGGSWPLKHLKQTKRYRLFFPFFLLGQLWENKVLKNINCFFALSQDEIDYLKKVAPNSTIKFQTMGIDDYMFKAIDKIKARKIVGWPLNQKIILFLGRINIVKGIPYLIDAMEELKDVQLKIIGWGDQKEYEEYTKIKGLKNVEFLGSVFGEAKSPYFNAADAFVLPSTKEGASVSVMEALAAGLPVVSTDTGGMPLMIHNNKEGIIIRQKSSKDIIKAVNEILTWKKKDIRKYANVYKWEKIVENTVKEYKK